MTEVLPIGVDLEFTVTRLAKIANASHLSVYWGILVRRIRRRGVGEARKMRARPA
jgi:hypothetical protein